SSLTWRSWEAQTVEGASRVGVPSGVVLPNESMLAPIGQFSAVNIVVPSKSRSRHADPIGSMRWRGSRSCALGSDPLADLGRGAPVSVRAGRADAPARLPPRARFSHRLIEPSVPEP